VEKKTNFPFLSFGEQSLGGGKREADSNNFGSKEKKDYLVESNCHTS
jgi:hypothetical protein